MSSLTTLVNETTQIKTDLISTRDTFKTKMTSKGFDTSSINKISDLVNLTDSLNNTRWEYGDGTLFKEDKNSVNYQCNTEFFLFRNMDLNDIDLKGVDVGSLKVNVNFQNGSSDGSNYVSYFVKADVVDANGTIIKTGNNSIAMTPGDNSNIIRDLNINLSEIKPTYSIKVYAKTSISDRYVRINHVKVSADLKVGNNVVPTVTGKKWASGQGNKSESRRSFYYKSGGGSNLYYLQIDNLDFKPKTVITYFDVNGSFEYNFACDMSKKFSNYYCPLSDTNLYMCYTYRRDDGAYIEGNGFLFPLYYSDRPVYWIAFE